MDSQWTTASVDIPVALKEGDNVASINDGTMDLTPGSHYSIADGIINITPDYMKNLGTVSEVTLTVNFEQGDKDTFKLIRQSKDDGGSKNRYIWDAVQNMSRDGVVDIKVKMRYVDDSITLWVDDQFAHTAQVSQAETTVGGMGLYVDNNGDILVKKVVFREIVPYQETEGEREPVTIENDGLSVRLDSDFPHVIDYTLNGKVMNGAELRYNYVTINTTDYKARLKSQSRQKIL